jgi:hypothetical protein
LISISGRVAADERVVEADRELGELAEARRRNAERRAELPRLEGLQADVGSTGSRRIFSGVRAATSSISTPPSADAITVTRLLARSSTSPR